VPGFFSDAMLNAEKPPMDTNGRLFEAAACVTPGSVRNRSTQGLHQRQALLDRIALRKRNLRRQQIDGS
jgi:hypothetical protein